MTKVAVIMAGGTGTRFWPLSRRDRPKQLLSIGNHPIMLQATIDRLRNFVDPDRILVVTAAEHAESTETLIDSIPPENIIVEPEGRDTAACSGLAAVLTKKRFGGDAVIGTFPADHRIQPTKKFSRYSNAAYEAADSLDGLITFGVKPDYPATGYGYIIPSKKTERIKDQTVLKVERFTEKPDRTQAMEYIETRDALWNSGMFFWSANRILDEINQHVPELARGLEQIRSAWESSGSLNKALEVHYGSLPEKSVDYAVLERTDRCWTLPVDFDWNDLGSWNSVDALFEPDRNGNVSHGDTILRDSHNNIIYEDANVTVGLVGMEDTVVVVTDDAVLVCPRSESESVKDLVTELKERGREELL